MAKFVFEDELDSWGEARRTHPWMSLMPMEAFLGYITAMTAATYNNCPLSPEELYAAYKKEFKKGG